MPRPFKLVGQVLIVVLAGTAVFAGWKWLLTRTKDGLPLEIKWEGAVNDYNYRDAGTSLNRCLGRPFFQTGKVMRANVWFSGWSCDRVGRPDVIYSLNFDPERGERYFCQGESEPVIGRHFNERRMNDLEYVETWNEADTKAGICGFFRDGLVSIARGQRILVHCDAGKDRTGTFVAMLAAMTAEAHGSLDDVMLDAIECDYQASENLEKAKYGRMRRFLSELHKQGGVAGFLEAQCGIERTATDDAVKQLFQPQDPS